MSATVSFHVEPWAEFKGEALRLWQLHWQEIALNQAQIPLNVHYAVYDALDSVGQISVIVARSEGQLVGYWVGMIRPHLHYATSLTAHTDVYYLLPDHRRGRTGIRLWQAVEREMRRRGVERILTATKKHVSPVTGKTLDMGPVFRHLGYTEVETCYAKMVRD